MSFTKGVIGSLAMVIGVGHTAGQMRWDTLHVTVSRGNAFGAVPSSVVACPEAVYILAGPALWTGHGESFSSRPLPGPEPLSQGPLCVEGGALVTLKAAGGGQNAYFSKPGGAWEDVTDRMRAADTCCGTLSSDGRNPAQSFANSLYRADGLPPSAADWESIPAPAGGYGAIGISPYGIATKKDGDSVLAFRRPADTAWSAWGPDSLGRYGYRLLGLDSDRAVLAVRGAPVSGVFSPGLDYYPERLCFAALGDGRTECPEGLNGKLPLVAYYPLGNGRLYARFFFSSRGRGDPTRGILFDRVSGAKPIGPALSGFNDGFHPFAGDSSSLFALENLGTFRRSRDLGETWSAIGEAEAPLGGAMEIVAHKRWAYLRDAYGRWHRVDTTGTGWKAGSPKADAAGMDSMQGVSSDGGFLFGENPLRKATPSQLPYPAFSQDDGQSWIYAGTAEYSASIRTAGYPVYQAHACGADKFWLASARLYEIPTTRLYRSSDTGMAEFAYPKGQWDNGVDAIACQGDEYLFSEYDQRGKLTRIAGDSVQRQAMKGLPDSSAHIYRMAMAGRYVFLVPHGSQGLYFADTSALEFSLVPGIPADTIRDFAAFGGTLLVAGSQGLYRLSLPESTTALKGAAFRRQPSIPAGSGRFQAWYRHAARWFTLTGRSAPH